MTQVKQEIQNMVVWEVFVFLPVKDNLIPLQFAFVFFFLLIWYTCIFDRVVFLYWLRVHAHIFAFGN